MEILDLGLHQPATHQRKAAAQQRGRPAGAAAAAGFALQQLCRSSRSTGAAAVWVQSKWVSAALSPCHLV